MLRHRSPASLFATAVTPGIFIAILAVAGCQQAAPATNVAPAAQQGPVSPKDALIARAKSLELDTPYVPPPGDPLEHHTAGFAKIMCSAVFITGLDPDFAAENVGLLHQPLFRTREGGKAGHRPRGQSRAHHRSRTASTLTAKYLGSQGCVTLPAGKNDG